MHRFLCVLTILVVLIAPSSFSEDDVYPTDERQYFPARLKWTGNGNSLSDKESYQEWERRLLPFMQGPDGIREVLHLYGWRAVTVINAGGFQIPIFGIPQRWEKSLHIYDGKVLFNQPDGSLTLIELESGKVLARSRNYNKYFNSRDQAKEKIVHRLNGAVWKRYGKVLVGEGVFVDSETGEILDDSDNTATWVFT